MIYIHNARAVNGKEAESTGLAGPEVRALGVGYFVCILTFFLQAVIQFNGPIYFSFTLSNIFLPPREQYHL